MGISGNPIDTNLVAGNIKDGVSIFGVAGNYTGSGAPVGTGFKLFLRLNNLFSYTSANAFTYYAKYGNILYFITNCFGSSLAGNNCIIQVTKYDLSTGIITEPLGTTSINPGFASGSGSVTVSSIYIDGTDMAINFTNSFDPARYRIYDLTNDTIGSFVVGTYTTGTLQSTLPQTVSGNTYTVSNSVSVIPGGGGAASYLHLIELT